jgi:amino acid adenylation domain-containing protein/FkbH-like protein/non-ribosomal peptide synthase protein (TIGR01720 family)/FkbM family methyltransferase
MGHQSIAIAATFTSELVEDFLSYWLEQLGITDRIEFAPYNQIFQELLNPTSLFAQNQNGINLILLRLEDWESNNHRLTLTVDGVEEILGGSDRHTLPNHLEIAHLNQYETEYLYQEIFGDRVYLRHRIVFNEDDCIIDVGANIGLFTLFAQQQCPQGTIYAFEPAPHAFEKLAINTKLYCQNVHLFNCGLGAENQEATFTFYPRSSVFSSFAADPEQDEKAIRSVILNILRRDDALDEVTLETLADEFLRDRLDRQIYQAQLRSLSEIIEEYQIERIDLLKLDAEKSELAIIQGIKEHHWALIKQIVIEVHDQEGSTIAAVMELLTAKGFEFVIDEESLLQGSGLYNIYAIRPHQKNSPKSSSIADSTSQIERNIRDLGSALKTALARSANPHLVSICPPTPRVSNEGFDRDRHQQLEELLAAELDGINGVYLVKSTELASIYPVENYYDAYGDEFGHIPYTPEFFGGLGTMLARKICALKSDPYKVIVLDCDNTLWSGVCGEDGVAGVKISSPYRALQAFIIAQQQAGKLICLCSKNQPEDVFAIFDEHQDMLLKREHLVSSCINWQPKSVNLKVLADELRLGLDSFIFIDDNPVECAEVRANCPEVLTLQLPAECDRILQFLEHIWAFDRLNVTQTDRQRTELYQQNIHRQQLQQATLTFADFISQLGLEIEISPLQGSELSRVAQLTQRTNQFNFTTIRRSEIELQQLSDLGRLESRVVRVKDRFGDYGLVGLILFEIQADAIIVDTFLLSCRVLGRGVEHQMLAELGTIAQARGLNWVEVAYLPTTKNQPAGDFLASIGHEFKLESSADRELFKLPSLTLSELKFTAIADGDPVNTQPVERLNSTSNSVASTASRSQLFEDIANKFYSPELILAEITAHQQRHRTELDVKFVSPRTPIEAAIASLFATVLKLDRVGIDDNFFELGGDSIRGAILINKLQAQLNEIVHFVVLFDTKTVAKLAGYLEKNYPQSVAKLLGQEIAIERQVTHQRIELAQVTQMRSLIPPLAPMIGDGTKNPRAIFMLSPHRSGSTLLRVILGGNPQLFAPPELELLSFNTLQERTAKLSGRYGFWLEGTIRTIMQIRGCSPEEAIALMEELTAQNITTKQFYHLIQSWIGDKILVDKTPSYSIDLATLNRAETDFDNPLYIHLVRHPYATIRSYEEARVEQTFPYEHPFERRELAELVWLISHQNILEFLSQIPAERQYQIKFEDLVTTPQQSVDSLCQFLGLEFHPDMLQPYQEKQQRMTDGIYAQSRMIGDVKFHEHQGINANTADSWRQDYTVDFLGDATWQVAAALGYAQNRGAIPQVRRENSLGLPTFPLSFAQQRLWILAQFEPDSPFYNMFRAMRLHGRVDVKILERSFNEIIRRHEILRTNFQITEEGTPVQIIAPTAQIKLSVVDLQGLSEREQSGQLQLVATESQLQPFALTEGLLFRVTLVQLQPESYALLLTMHHIIGDGWSMGVITAELSRIYQSLSIGEPSPLPALPIQYVDFTIWQRQWLRGAALQTQINYWQQQLAAAPPLLELPTDRARPSIQTFRGGCYSFELTPQLTTDLQALSQKSDTTMFMTLMAAYAILLHRYSGQTDLLVGTPIASRNHQDIEPLIGFFVNTLVLRTQVAENSSYAELLSQVRSTAMDAYGHQDVPFEQIIETLKIERSLSHTPLFQVVFALQNTPMAQLTTADLAIAPLQLDNVNAKCDLTLQVWETETAAGNALTGFWQYNTDLFDPGTIERMSGHFQTLLAGIVANPSQQISQLPLLTAVEQQQLLVEWNDTQVDYPQDKCIHQLFEEQVERTPDAVAVVFEQQQLTYSELNCRANQLAHYLRSFGVGADVLVGICVERSLDTIVGLLGILKAGGAYVPLDPEYPTERLAYMVADSQVALLLTQQRLVAKLPESKARVVSIDRSWTQIAQQSQVNPVSGVQDSNLVNVIYTSGSTGQPKGVMVKHSGLYNLAQSQIKLFDLLPSSHVLQFASFSFDAAVSEVVMALGSGAKLYLGTKDALLPGAGLMRLLQNERITHITLPPSALAVMPLAALPALTTLIVAGETCAPDLIKQWSVGRRCFNAYGPTEATVCATVAECSNGDEQAPIGRPIANTQIYILDQDLQPVPIGIPGELHIGGAGLTRGYLNRPELTTAKFISNPFNTDSNSRLYKTGDLARYLSDGNIEYLGRIDNQVKIRGFRIELGEIETVLSQHPQIQSAVVIAREDNPGSKRLVAYIVPQPQQIYIERLALSGAVGVASPSGEVSRSTLTTSQLRQFLKTQLPDYMVPNAIVILESLPLTPNGKIDRRALPAPESRGGIEVSLVAPRNPIEAILAQIWAQVLRVEQVGVHDNFFELGGDSILSIQIISRAKQAGLQLTVKQLFGNQTIAELATVADTISAIEIDQGLVTGTVPLTPIQHWFFEHKLPAQHHFNQSFLLSVPANIKLELLEQVWQQLLKHHDTLRLRFRQSDSGWEQIYSAPTDRQIVSFVDLSTLPESEQTTIIETTATQLQASLNLGENLVQVALFGLGIDNRARLLIAIHHLVIDGVSWRILLEDLQTAYQQISQGKTIQLPPKTTAFKQWSQQLTAYAQSTALKSELANWLKTATSGASVARLPLDEPKGANTIASTRTVSVSLNESETQALLQDVPKAYRTQINDVLVTALALVLGKWTNSKTVRFNLEGHGREELMNGVDLSRTIGWFTTIFPVMVELEDTENLGTAIKSVKEQLRAIPHKGIGYGLLRHLNSDPEITTQLETLPLAEVSFNYLGQFAQVLNKSSLMQLAPESSGIDRSLEGQRLNLLDINSVIKNEKLQIDWAYSSNIHQCETIEHIAAEFIEALREIIAHCLVPGTEGYTPSDFPLIQLNQLELDRVLTSLLKPELGQTNWQNIEDIYPLSPLQQGMLFESLYAPESGVYFEQTICTLTGNIDVLAFEQAWQQIVTRYSIFRTAFIWESLNQPLQVVYRQANISVTTDDWRELSALEQHQQLEIILAADRQQGWQLSQVPLMRLYLLQLTDNSYQFVWSFHHLLLDGWSLPVVFKDLLDFYQICAQGESLRYEPTVNYRNYIAWLQQQDRELAEEFWSQKLQGFTAPTPLTVAKPLSNNEQQHSIYRKQEIKLTVPATAAIQSFARQHQLTLNSLVQATWGLLLSRYSGESDIVFGATVSGRPPELVGVESMVGLFINTLPVRVQISAETELLGLLKDLQAQQVESEQFSYSSLVEIQGLSDVPRGTSLFESIVVFENYPVDAASLQDNRSFSFSNLRGIEQTNYPLTVIAVPKEQLLVKMSYDPIRFDDETISRMLGHFVTVLEGIVANPSQQIAQLPLLTAVEQQQLLVKWNDTQVDYPQEQCIQQLFAAQVERTPDAVAIVFENQQLTYRELNVRANQLAHYLQSLGVEPDVLVGICVERSLETIVGILAILKAGGAYVPLDPDYPTERLRFILADAQVDLLLSQQHLVEKLPQHQARVVCLDTDWAEIAHNSESNPLNVATASNLAYVIYTSGSTGQPKGVLVNHANVVRLFAATEDLYHFDEQDVWTLFHSYAFDFSVWEIWGALLYGGRLVVVPYLVTRSPESFYQLLCQEQVTILNQTPSAFRQLIAAEQSLGTADDLKLRLVIFGGEALELTSLQPWFDRHGDESPQLVNMYGITETTVHVTYRPLSKGDLQGTANVIGRPIADLQVYLLDPHLQPVPIGVPGEMYIGGAGVTCGYLHRPELTAGRFISNPFHSGNPLPTPSPSKEGSRSEGRLYKSGDLARYLPNGELEYLGRIDEQVKIRGFRIELGEIEALLAQHPAVRESVVVVREDEAGDKRLVAYAIPQTAQSPQIGELRQFLKAKLPDYMVPNAIVILESLPLTPSGKIDRRALPAPDSQPELKDKYVAPSTPIEAMLVQIWAQVLKVEQVGIHDNFFELGGHSLLATQLFSRIRSDFQVEVPLRSLFAAATVAELGRSIQDLQQQNLKLTVTPILPRKRNAE